MASTKEVDGSAAATMLLATLTAAAASFRPSSAGSTLRKQLHMRHKDGIAVGSLCIPVICATILVGDPNNGVCARAFWLATTCTLLTTLRVLAPGSAPAAPPTQSARAVLSTSSTDAAIASTAAWAVILAFSIGMLGVGVVPSLVAVAAMDGIAGLLQPVFGFSAGELCVVGEGLIILADMACNLASSAWSSPSAVVLQDEAHIVNIMLVVLLFGTLLAAVALIPVFCRYGRKNAEPDAPLDRTKPVMGHSTVLYVYAVLLAAMAVLETPWLHALIGQNPFAWAGHFMTSRPSRFAWTAYWVVVLTVVVKFAPTAGTTAIPNIVIRKFFHAVAVFMFAPVILWDLQLMRLAFVIVTMVLLFAEYLRIVRLPTVGLGIHSFMAKYIDARDAGFVTVTHLYLIIGCAFSVWLPYQHASSLGNVVLFSGLLILGVGDAAAAYFGTYYGKSSWPGTRKTLEGTAAGFVCVLLSVTVLQFVAFAFGLPHHIINVSTFELIQFSAATACVCLLETFTKQVDNLILPLYYFSCLVLLSPTV